MLWWRVSILIGSLLETTCNFQFKFARASCQVPVFDIPVLRVKVNFIYAGWPIQHSGWYPEGPC